MKIKHCSLLGKLNFDMNQFCFLIINHHLLTIYFCPAPRNYLKWTSPLTRTSIWLQFLIALKRSLWKSSCCTRCVENFIVMATTDVFRLLCPLLWLMHQALLQLWMWTPMVSCKLFFHVLLVWKKDRCRSDTTLPDPVVIEESGPQVVPTLPEVPTTKPGKQLY